MATEYSVVLTCQRALGPVRAVSVYSVHQESPRQREYGGGVLTAAAVTEGEGGVVRETASCCYVTAAAAAGGGVTQEASRVGSPEQVRLGLHQARREVGLCYLVVCVCVCVRVCECMCVCGCERVYVFQCVYGVCMYSVLCVYVCV